MKNVFYDYNNRAYYPGKGEKIGWRLSVYVLVFNKKGELLVVKTKLNDFFGLPGGGLEPGESIDSGLNREALEEIGCEVKKNGHAPVFIGETNFYDLSEGGYLRSINIFYHAELMAEEDKLRCSPEHEILGIHWKKPDDLRKENMFNNVYPCVEFLKNNSLWPNSL